jgi:hypothetical protein
MTGCPYTWFKSLLPLKSSKSEYASLLRVTVKKDQIVCVDVSLPAKSAGWLIDLIPEDVVEKIRSEGIPIDQIQANLGATKNLLPQRIFELIEPQRIVNVWLE